VLITRFIKIANWKGDSSLQIFLDTNCTLVTKFLTRETKIILYRANAKELTKL
jgi:hypothetical protein